MKFLSLTLKVTLCNCGQKFSRKKVVIGMFSFSCRRINSDLAAATVMIHNIVKARLVRPYLPIHPSETASAAQPKKIVKVNSAEQQKLITFLLDAVVHWSCMLK